MYIQEIDKILELPQGAAETDPIPETGPQSFTIGWLGKKTSKCFLHAIGPIPGPPPPWGIQKVLCKFMWQTSGPKLPGLAIPTNAFKFAPSI